MRRLMLIVLLLPALLAPATAASAEDSGTSDLHNITLRDAHGQERTLKEFADSDLLVVAFLGTECPLAKLYGRRLDELAKRFADRSVSIVGVDSNVQDSLDDVLRYVNRHDIEIPILLDPQHKVADLLKAERTPEVVVLDRERQVRYQGRVDDQYAISVQRTKPTREDLVEAIESVLAGKDPEVDRTKVVGCIIGRREKKKPHGDITYSKHVAPIINKRCTECHREGEIAPFSLTSFEDTVGWGAMMAEVITEGRMPPWNANPEHGHFKNDARLTDDEKKLILTWIDNGSPEGDPADLPEPPTWTAGWRIEKPDMVVKMRDNEFQVPATGVVDYQYWTVDPNFEKDMWVTAVEARPGNPEVVHHIVVYLLAKGQRRVNLGKMLIGYAPGTSPLIYPSNAAMRIPKGTRLLFELHYTPNGRAQSDMSYIGMKFLEEDKVEQEIVGSLAIEHDFGIPPNHRAFEVTADRTLKEDMRLLTLTPHMHLRGKAFKYVAHYPKDMGREPEVLLDVPAYDFNWQLRYELAEPKLLPRGTTIKCVGTFDNSPENPNNPNPERTVRWGEQSWEEMMIGFYTGVRPRK